MGVKVYLFKEDPPVLNFDVNEFFVYLRSTVILNVKLDSSRNLELRIYEIFGSRNNPTIGVIVRSY